MIGKQNNRIVVTEYPKSGGSWVVSMLGSALGLPKRDVYIGNGYDRFDVSKHPWYAGAPDFNLTESCVIKSHELPGSTWLAFPAQFIHMVRDGRDVVVSKYFYEKDFCVANGIYESFDEPFDLYVPRVAREWRDYVLAWLDVCPLTYRYEDFLRDPFAALKQALVDLEGVVADERIHAAVAANTKEEFSRSLEKVFKYSSFVRKATAGDWRQYFSDEHIRVFEQIAGDALDRLGYARARHSTSGQPAEQSAAQVSGAGVVVQGSTAVWESAGRAQPTDRQQDRQPSGQASGGRGMSTEARCWCGNVDLVPFSAQYLRCPACETLITAEMPAPEFTSVNDDERDFYGREYWFAHQEQDLGQANIVRRARSDLPERALHWLRALLKYKQPPGKALELGSAHGGFVALMRLAGFDASGLELSPWVVDFARKTFEVPMLLGPIEDQQIEPGSLDAIALMDVLEHLPDPLGTMRRCLDLLKPDGVLLIQTPRYAEGKTYDEMRAESDRFVEQLKHEQHLYLFSQTAVRELFDRLGARHLAFEPAIFAHYDMFLVASREPFTLSLPQAIEQHLGATPSGRIAQALLDMDEQRASLGRRGAELEHAAQAAGVAQSRVAALEADVEYLKRQLIAAEADRAARLQVIQSQGARIGQLEADRAGYAKNLRLLLQKTRARGLLRVARSPQLRGIAERIARSIRRTKLQGARIDATPSQSAAVQSVSIKQPNRATNGAGKPVAADTNDLMRQIRDPKTAEPLNLTPAMTDEIVRQLQARGFSVQELTLDPAEYREYFAQAGYTKRYPTYYTFNLPEKSLEHFVAAKLLELHPDDVYIDIASEHSPVPDIYSRLFGCTSYRQDLAYPAGLNGDRIGGDAAAMPVPDGFAAKMALHCSFEHFEGDADMRFIREIERVLRPGGKVLFAPIYLFREYAILTDPQVAVEQQVPFEADAVVYCKPGWQNRHGRFYDPAHLADRIKGNLGAMQMTIFRVTNATAIDPSCYITFAAMISKP